MMDPVSDMLVQIKNASLVGKPTITVPHSKLKAEIARVLIKEGYLKEAVNRGKKVEKFLTCEIAYAGKQPKIHDVKRVSKPSKRVYGKSIELKPFKQGVGMSVVSTSKGLMTDKEAREAKLGGEILFKIW